MKLAQTRTGVIKQIDDSPKALEKFGVYSGDIVKLRQDSGVYKKGVRATVIGFCEGFLWFQVENVIGISYWDDILDKATLLEKLEIVQPADIKQLDSDISAKLLSCVENNKIDDLNKLVDCFDTFNKLGIDTKKYFPHVKNNLINIAINLRYQKIILILIEKAKASFTPTDVLLSLQTNLFIAVKLLKILNNSLKKSGTQFDKNIIIAIAQIIPQFIEELDNACLTEKIDSEFVFNVFETFYQNLPSTTFTPSEVQQVAEYFGNFFIKISEKYMQLMYYENANSSFDKAEKIFLELKEQPSDANCWIDLGFIKQKLLREAFEQDLVELDQTDNREEVFKKWKLDQVLPYFERAAKQGNEQAKILIAQLKSEQYDLQWSYDQRGFNTNRTLIKEAEVKEILDNILESIPYTNTKLSKEPADTNHSKSYADYFNQGHFESPIKSESAPQLVSHEISLSDIPAKEPDKPGKLGP